MGDELKSFLKDVFSGVVAGWFVSPLVLSTGIGVNPPKFAFAIPLMGAVFGLVRGSRRTAVFGALAGSVGLGAAVMIGAPAFGWDGYGISGFSLMLGERSKLGYALSFAPNDFDLFAVVCMGAVWGRMLKDRKSAAILAALLGAVMLSSQFLFFAFLKSKHIMLLTGPIAFSWALMGGLSGAAFGFVRLRGEGALENAESPLDGPRYGVLKDLLAGFASGWMLSIFLVWSTPYSPTPHFYLWVPLFGGLFGLLRGSGSVAVYGFVSGLIGIALAFVCFYPTFGPRWQSFPDLFLGVYNRPWAGYLIRIFPNTIDVTAVIALGAGWGWMLRGSNYAAALALLTALVMAVCAAWVFPSVRLYNITQLSMKIACLYGAMGAMMGAAYGLMRHRAEEAEKSERVERPKAPPLPRPTEV